MYGELAGTFHYESRIDDVRVTAVEPEARHRGHSVHRRYRFQIQGNAGHAISVGSGAFNNPRPEFAPLTRNRMLVRRVASVSTFRRQWGEASPDIPQLSSARAASFHTN